MPATGAMHLQMLAREPRPAGGAAEERARRMCEQSLAAAGYTTRRERFEYSVFPGRYATPLAGLLSLSALLVSAFTALHGRVVPSVVVLLGAVMLVSLFARAMSGDGVLTVPWLRAHGENVIAFRGATVPRVWLAAHIDSKSQPVPSAVRIAGILLMLAALSLSVVASALQLAGHESRTLWWLVIGTALLGAPGVLGATVGSVSPGAVDNASGVAAVLSAAEMIERDRAVGVLLTSAEELGLAGARAWARSQREAGVVLNCDGVDDAGPITIMHGRSRPDRLIEVLRVGAKVRVRRMPLGLLTDSVAFATRGWQAVTVSRGSLRTLSRVHTKNDSLARMDGRGIDEVARLLAHAVEELTR